MADAFHINRANGNALAARRFYMEQFSNRRVPSHTLFQNLYQRLCESDLFRTRHRHSDRYRSVLTPKTPDTKNCKDNRRKSRN